jgi:hypothetical protein
MARTSRLNKGFAGPGPRPYAAEALSADPLGFTTAVRVRLRASCCLCHEPVPVPVAWLALLYEAKKLPKARELTDNGTPTMHSCSCSQRALQLWLLYSAYSCSVLADVRLHDTYSQSYERSIELDLTQVTSNSRIFRISPGGRRAWGPMRRTYLLCLKCAGRFYFGRFGPKNQS